ncbi:uncharacterized protein LOC141725622 [Zonotrichia albicollis]|uniref:uncharacterized protein LOC141725622 n=1 Tax=Zonotrichia albicollis TaxID=44394 RepID=UPI003D80D446
MPTSLCGHCPLPSPLPACPPCSVYWVGLGAPLERRWSRASENSGAACLGPDGFGSWGDGAQSHELSPSRAPQAPSLRATASRGVHPPEGFIPPASRGVHPPCIQRGSPPSASRGVHPPCIQRSSSPFASRRVHPPCIQRGSTPQRGSSPQRGSPHTDSEGSSLSASRGIHPLEGFIPPRGIHPSRGVHPHCIQRDSPPSASRGVHPPEGFTPLHPEGFIPQRGSSPTDPEGLIPSEGFTPLASEGVFPTFPLLQSFRLISGGQSSGAVSGIKRKICSVQARAGWPRKHLGRLFVRVRWILGSDRCSFPLGRSPSSLWQRSLGFLPGLGNACSPP